MIRDLCVCGMECTHLLSGNSSTVKASADAETETEFDKSGSNKFEYVSLLLIIKLATLCRVLFSAKVVMF